MLAHDYAHPNLAGGIPRRGTGGLLDELGRRAETLALYEPIVPVLANRSRGDLTGYLGDAGIEHPPGVGELAMHRQQRIIG